MNISSMSSKFVVEYIKESEINKVYSLCKENPMYYKYCPPFITIQEIKTNMFSLPKGKTLEDKHYVGFYANNNLIAVLDLICKYPNEETAFIGFFIMSRELQGKGEGTKIITEVCEYLKTIGFQKLKLGYAKGNSQSEMFWRKNDFSKTGVEIKTDSYTIVVMEKIL